MYSRPSNATVYVGQFAFPLISDFSDDSVEVLAHFVPFFVCLRYFDNRYENTSMKPARAPRR